MGPHEGGDRKSDTDEAYGQTWTLAREHSAMVELRRASIDSMSSREHGRGSARKSAPESAVFATISSVDAMAAAGGPLFLTRAALLLVEMVCACRRRIRSSYQLVCELHVPSRLAKPTLVTAHTLHQVVPTTYCITMDGHDFSLHSTLSFSKRRGWFTTVRVSGVGIWHRLIPLTCSDNIVHSTRVTMQLTKQDLGTALSAFHTRGGP